MNYKKQCLSTLVGILAGTSIAFAQTTVSTVSTSTQEGSISTLDPAGASFTVTQATGPARTYSVTKQTEVVDPTGRVVTFEQVKQGTPVSVEYLQDGERVVVRRVKLLRPVAVVPSAPPPVREVEVVRPASPVPPAPVTVAPAPAPVVPAPAPVVREKETTTTTTTTHE